MKISKEKVATLGVAFLLFGGSQAFSMNITNLVSPRLTSSVYADEAAPAEAPVAGGEAPAPAEAPAAGGEAPAPAEAAAPPEAPAAGGEAPPAPAEAAAPAAAGEQLSYFTEDEHADGEKAEGKEDKDDDKGEKEEHKEEGEEK